MRAFWRHEGQFSWVVGKQVFPGHQRRPSDGSMHVQEFWNHIDLSSNLSSPLVSCGTWGSYFTSLSCGTLLTGPSED